MTSDSPRTQDSVVATPAAANTHTGAGTDLHPLFLDDDVRAIVFDLDGTLIDSAADILHGMRLMFQETGLGQLPDDYFPDDLHGTGAGIMRSIAADMGWTLPSDLSSLHETYIRHYTDIRHRNTRLYDGADTILKAVHQAGLPLGICTNKVRANALTAMKATGILDLFSFVTGCDTWEQAKPSPVPLLETIRMLGSTPAQCLYFGDTSVDALCARDAGVRFVLHESGYGDNDLHELPRHFTFSSWKELGRLQPAHVTSSESAG